MVTKDAVLFVADKQLNCNKVKLGNVQNPETYFMSNYALSCNMIQNKFDFSPLFIKKENDIVKLAKFKFESARGDIWEIICDNVYIATTTGFMPIFSCCIKDVIVDMYNNLCKISGKEPVDIKYSDFYSIKSKFNGNVVVNGLIISM